MRDLNFEERSVLISVVPNSRLNPCSQCGGKSAARITINYLKQTARAYCRSCEHSIEIVEKPDYEGDIVEDIIERWNND